MTIALAQRFLDHGHLGQLYGHYLVDLLEMRHLMPFPRPNEPEPVRWGTAPCVQQAPPVILMFSQV